MSARPFTHRPVSREFATTNAAELALNRVQMMHLEPHRCTRTGARVTVYATDQSVRDGRWCAVLDNAGAIDIGCEQPSCGACATDTQADVECVECGARFISGTGHPCEPPPAGIVPDAVRAAAVRVARSAPCCSCSACRRGHQCMNRIDEVDAITLAEYVLGIINGGKQ